MEKILLAILLAATAFALYAGYAAAPAITLAPSPTIEATAEAEIIEPTLAPTTAAAQTAASARSISIKLLGVDDAGEGKTADLLVELVTGKGAVFVALDPEVNPALQDETQQSLKTAVELGRKLATVDSTKYDLRYTLTAPTQTVGGKSAGAAMTVATVALLTDSRLRRDTAITGGVDSDGTVTRVGGVLAKARAAKKAGFKKLVVPVGEAVAYENHEECTEEQLGAATARRCVLKSTQVNVSEAAGITVVEAANVQAALAEMRA